MHSTQSWTSILQQERPRLLAVAYRMLGSFSDAENVLQEVWLRAHKILISTINVPVAWLTTALTRLCLDHLGAAAVRRGQYVGPWLPEPIATGQELSAFDTKEPLIAAESISLALLQLLEALDPSERAVYVLHELFEHPHADVAEIVGITEVNSRQLARKARAHVASANLRYSPSASAHSELLNKFLQAVQGGATQQLQQLLSQQVVLRSDGGGKVKAALNPIAGAEQVARFLFGVAGKQAAEGGWTVQALEVNGLPSVVALYNGTVAAVLSVESDGTQIYSVFLIVNPEKLRMVHRSLKSF